MWVRGNIWVRGEYTGERGGTGEEYNITKGERGKNLGTNYRFDVRGSVINTITKFSRLPKTLFLEDRLT